MNNDGYINLARKILTDENFDEKHPFSKREAYIDLILLSSFSDEKFNASIRSLADRWQWGKTKVGNFLLWLEKNGYIKLERTQTRTQTRTESRTLQTLVNTAFAHIGADTNADTKEREKERSKEKDLRSNTPYNTSFSKENSVYNPPPEKRFVKPTVDEVRRYCIERGNRVNAEQFVNFYESKGWKVGNQPMKDWKACVRTWEVKDRAASSTVTPVKKTAFHNFEERHTDYDALFAEMQKTRGVV